ncbi:MAG: SET domain-containing protein-lysine N-methyltransferase [Desulfobacterales bacterium]
MRWNDKNVYREKDEILKLFRDQNVVYLTRTRIGWEPLREINLENSTYYLESREVFQELSRRYHEDIEKGNLAPLYIKKIDERLGFGVFAADEIKKDDFIGEYAGVIQIPGKDAGGEMEEGGYESDFSWYYLDKIADGPELEINGRLEGNEMRFVNHGDNFNVDVEHTIHDGHWIIFFKAARDIQKDEQFLISYGDGYWDEDCRKRLKL